MSAKIFGLASFSLLMHAKIPRVLPRHILGRIHRRDHRSAAFFLTFVLSVSHDLGGDVC